MIGTAQAGIRERLADIKVEQEIAEVTPIAIGAGGENQEDGREDAQNSQKKT